MDDFLTTRNFTMAKFLTSDMPIQGYENPSLVSGANPANAGISTSGRFLPFDLLTRDMSVSSFGTGGALVGEKVQSSIIPVLRAQSVCARLGATPLTGLKPPQGAPVMLGDLNAQWLPEGQTVATSDIALGQVLTTPHRISISLNASKLLAHQSEPDFGAFVAEQATRKLFQALDQAALTGTGGALPIGILNAAGVSTVTFGGAASWAKILEFEKDIGNANADGPRLGWAQSPNVRAKWKAAPRLTGASTFLQEADNTVNGYPSAMTTELNAAAANDQVVFGNWADLAIGIFFDGVWVVAPNGRNPYSRSDYGEDRYTFHLYCDVSLLRPASFCISTDSAAQ